MTFRRILEIAFMVSIFSIQTNGNQLNYIGKIKNDSADVNGLNDAKCVKVTSDDKFVYVAGENDHSICWFRRGANSELLFSGRVKNDSNNVTGLEWVYDFVLSKNEKYLYAVTYYSNTLVWFSRNFQTGELSFAGKLDQDTNGVDGLYIPIRSVLSPSGKFLYTASYNDSTVGLFSIDTATGKPIFLKVYKDGRNGIDGLAGAYDICIVPDGSTAYVAAKKDSSVAWFQTDESTGQLSFRGIARFKAVPCSTLIYPSIVISSVNGKFVYVASDYENRIAWFSRNLSTGGLAFIGEVVENQNGVKGLHELSDMKFIDNNQKLITTGSDGVSLFNIDTSSGELRFLENSRPNSLSFSGSNIAFSSDYNDIYVAGFEGCLFQFRYSQSSEIKCYNTNSINVNKSIAGNKSFNLLGQRIVLNSTLKDNAKCIINQKECQGYSKHANIWK